MISRRRQNKRNDQGNVAMELVLVMPFIIALIACIIALGGLYSTKSRVVGAAHDGARALSLKAGVASPNADPNAIDGITVTLDGPACPELSNPAYQTATPPRVTAKAAKTYHLSVPFIPNTWTPDIQVTEKAIVLCG